MFWVHRMHLLNHAYKVTIYNCKHNCLLMWYQLFEPLFKCCIFLNLRLAVNTTLRFASIKMCIKELFNRNSFCMTFIEVKFILLSRFYRIFNSLLLNLVCLLFAGALGYPRCHIFKSILTNSWCFLLNVLNIV
jgi:hypothetical protein